MKEVIDAIKSKLEFDKAESMMMQGLISEKGFDQYQFCWIWMSVRLSNVCNASRLQQSYCNKYGTNKFYSRINRVRKAAGLQPYYGG